MTRSPRPKHESILSNWLVTRYIITGLYVGFATIGVFVWWYLDKGVCMYMIFIIQLLLLLFKAAFCVVCMYVYRFLFHNCVIGRNAVAGVILSPTQVKTVTVVYYPII